MGSRRAEGGTLQCRRLCHQINVPPIYRDDLHHDTEVFEHGIFRVLAAAPSVTVGNPQENVDAMVSIIESAKSDLIVFPELALTGYTCGDLFGCKWLLDAAERQLQLLADRSRKSPAAIVVGTPLRVQDSLMNVAAVIHQGTIIGFVPKSFLPTYREFYEGRHFRASSPGDPNEVHFGGQPVPFGSDLIFHFGEAVLGIEICEDLWTPLPPSGYQAVAGANVLINLSASNETIGKAEWRRDLVRSQSGRCIAGYVYASAGPGESTSDLVFGGHCLIAENGSLVGQSRRIGDGQSPAYVNQTEICCDLDLQRLAHDRRVVGSFDDAIDHTVRTFRHVHLQKLAERTAPATLKRHVDAHPFVPSKSEELSDRCAEIFAVQSAGLVKRLSCLSPSTPLAIGISGGLDSTLALLVALHAVDAAKWPRSSIIGITMPGFGTTKHTKTSADLLIEQTGITGECIEIRQLCLDTFRSLGHSPLGITIDDQTTVESLQTQLNQMPDDAADLTFENVQARIRTMLLMNRGFVLGTGDMSEQALGWSTYNADHMSMYNVNTSIPKTLVRFLVRFAADHHFTGETTELLHRIADTPISPELLPPGPDGSIRQNTEASIGAYELHDFFLYQFVRNGFDREKVLYLAKQATFDSTYDAKTIESTLDQFAVRFFRNQFKRNCVPDGPKVGSVSLSPRGDWRMPSDADHRAF
ncbi:NAD(+) synthase [Rhodopirellula sp. MGV]|uniref:NAD(+) synthase n=1 Tax=Rhodopirellula sp. MGV TaxID=2023130 RepID=UPI000B976155|nr:NAD(+) synthase [Rhodopirellula sp. MGV]OYP36336.1 NAD(+) synthase [Rhodopirellula sp. MGV]PNY38429.1 NAD(+) synthase [Rhodopirellula baltica]